jgi:hypothetical protein
MSSREAITLENKKDDNISLICLSSKSDSSGARVNFGGLPEKQIFFSKGSQKLSGGVIFSVMTFRKNVMASSGNSSIRLSSVTRSNCKVNLNF